MEAEQEMSNMGNITFTQSLTESIKKKQSHMCVGLDSDFERIPYSMKKNNSTGKAIFEFNKKLIDATYDIVVAYKPNLVFYSAYGNEGLKALKKTNEYVKRKDASIKLIAECKRTEIGKTAELSAKELFQEYSFDALNIMPWYGSDSTEEFKKWKGQAVFVICHDSNPSSIEMQNIRLKNGTFMYEYVAGLIANKWNTSRNILIETALTYPKELKSIVSIAGSKEFFLIVGLGAQGGVLNNLRVFKARRNFVVSASRSVIFASNHKNFDQAARSVVLDYNTAIHRLFT